jgi:hypothetical protein
MKKYFLTLAAVTALALTAAAAPYGTNIVQNGSIVPATFPAYSPFLSVDVNINQSGSYNNQSGFTAWNVAGGTSPGSPISATFGSVGVTLTARNSAGAAAGARDRGALGTDTWSSLYRDFYFIGHNSAVAFGLDYLRLDLTGLTPGQQYEFTGWTWDTGSSTLNNYEAWGIVNPSNYLAGLGQNNGYSPQDVNFAPGGANGVPALGRSFMGNSYPTDPNNPYASKAGFVSEYASAAAFMFTADGSGNATIYAWNDSIAFTGQQAAVINGFQLGLVPEPTTLTLLGIGALLGLYQIRRHRG